MKKRLNGTALNHKLHVQLVIKKIISTDKN